ncbi:DinB family protein [Reichenbachiella agariperforans]|uniref:DinB family protein n=1 Tax=Reichenbachiella agariperforans TaxID=156994 RepID=UPI001C09D406|nr:DinB family protein [Reichenbachiella agariperforans]MBU2915675.1 DinB family protein [Reichenbachiella agariperforans]
MSIRPSIDNIFEQLTELLSVLDRQEYSQPVPLLNGATIGQHIRHTLEFFVCLMDGVEQGCVNYDQRQRDLVLENSPVEAISCIHALRDRMTEGQENIPLRLEQSLGQEGELVEIQTNLDRELIYNIEHAVHHMALIRVGLKDVKPNLELSEAFGIASSTIRYRQTQLRKV